jgi:hypothetical protein
LETTLPDGRKTRFPKIPLRIGDHNFDLRNDPPREGSEERLLSLELDRDRIAALKKEGVIGPLQCHSFLSVPRAEPQANRDFID